MPSILWWHIAVCGTLFASGRNGWRLLGGATQAFDSVRRYDGVRFGLCIHCWVTRACGETSSGHYPGRRLANIWNIGPCPSNIEGQLHRYRIGSCSKYRDVRKSEISSARKTNVYCHHPWWNWLSRRICWGQACMDRISEIVWRPAAYISENRLSEYPTPKRLQGEYEQELQA